MLDFDSELELIDFSEIAKSFVASNSARTKRTRVATNPYDFVENRELFEQWWKEYHAACKTLNCLPGDKKGAANAWTRLESSGVNLQDVIEGTQWDIEGRLKNPGIKSALPHGWNYVTYSRRSCFA